MLTIKKNILPKGHHNRPGRAMKAKGLLYHTTNNWSDGASDEMHGKYMLTTKNTVSWHDTVDHDSMTQHIPHNENAWHAGDGGKGHYNNNWIGLEIACNRVAPGEKLDKETYDNAVEAAALIMQENNLDSMEEMAPHNVVYGKNCPHTSLFDRDQFERDVMKVLQGEQKVEYNEPKVGTVVITKPPVATKPRATVYRFGDNGKQIGYIQARLSYHGENPGPTDNSFGSRTLEAVRQFQRKQGLSVDGLIGPATMAALEKTKTSVQKVTRKYPGIIKLKNPMMRDAKGKTDIQAIQDVLGLKEDGIFGPLTEKAVKAYQKKHGLNQDGIVGPKTWDEMF